MQAALAFNKEQVQRILEARRSVLQQLTVAQNNRRNAYATLRSLLSLECICSAVHGVSKSSCHPLAVRLAAPIDVMVPIWLSSVTHPQGSLDPVPALSELLDLLCSMHPHA